jgi:death-on-curing protein
VTPFLTLEEALAIGSAVTGGPLELRDAGLLEAALARPRTTVFGQDAYPSLHEKAAALLHSIVANHPAVDGNKRLRFACTAIFLRINGSPLTLDEDAAYDLVIVVADGSLDDVALIWLRVRGA